MNPIFQELLFVKLKYSIWEAVFTNVAWISCFCLLTLKYLRYSKDIIRIVVNMLVLIPMIWFDFIVPLCAHDSLLINLFIVSTVS